MAAAAGLGLAERWSAWDGHARQREQRTTYRASHRQVGCPPPRMGEQ